MSTVEEEYDITDTPPMPKCKEKEKEISNKPKTDSSINSADVEDVSKEDGVGDNPINNRVENISTDDVLDSGATPQDELIDGPFSRFSLKPQQQSYTVNEERKDREGIVFTHTTYNPKKPTKAFNYDINSDFVYKMETFPRGRMTIINVKFFQHASGMADYPRHGTDRDAQGLVDLFLDLGFIVERYDNPTRRDMMNILKVAANSDYSKMSCCGCAILTHGEEGILYGTDEYINIREVTRFFRSGTLAGKPKLFLFQACQGSEYMDPLDSVDAPPSRKEQSEEDMALTLPAESDFVYAYSTVPGYYSWRNSKNGSWFIEALVATFRQYAHNTDVLRMLTRVNAVVSGRKSRTDSRSTDNKRQIASIITQMRKEFFLYPPYGPLTPKV